ncbi:hypothetical protein, partial [Rathayibacter rathayi]|uniref:hypothetical protein n=1 Tax=Rathayibacter rathayi TaxID=33887 RepID=UPI000D3F70AB
MASKRRSPPRPRRAPRPLFSSGAPDLLAVGDSPVLRTPGGVTGVGDHWSDPGWRPERSTTAHDPWNPTAATPVADGVALTPAGAL